MHNDDLIIVDQLYGAITIPGWLKPVVHSPELQRLREVRLINTTSPSCGSLSDARRFTHTIGVLHLASRIGAKITDKWSKEESKAFLIAALLHDIGTPAFGHLFEYQLASIRGWNHEKFVLDIIKGTYDTSKIYHQIYYNNSLKLHEILREMKVDIELVVDLVNGNNILGQLLAGVLDLDNIDNVFRMAVLLGLSSETQTPLNLVSYVIPEKSGIVFDEKVVPLIDVWMSLRRKAYEILAFDEYCLSGQAMLTDCFTIALTKNFLDERHWYFTDEQLLREFLNYSETKEVIQRFAIGDYYSSIYLDWYNKPKGKVDLRHPDNRLNLIQAVKSEFKVNCSPYIFYDSGTFSKKLNLRVKDAGGNQKDFEYGERSQSTIVSIFSRQPVSPLKKKQIQEFVRDYLADYGLRREDLKNAPLKQNVYRITGQREIPFGT
jgi:HD superfamily phosphohydrolase